MTQSRTIEPEWLDELPPDDPRAIRSRRDLRRINRIMGHVGFFTRSLPIHFEERPPRRIVEIGTGDGTMLLSLAHRLAPSWPGVEVTLLDLHPVVSTQTTKALSALGWKSQIEAADVFDWATRDESVDVVIANLFLHHFPDDALSRLFHHFARRTRLLIACEPRRDALALATSRLVGLIGCNDVTRHDAVISVRAGFRDRELSGLWPSGPHWKLDEARAGLFSHGFVASRAQEPA
jgi:hypothetical protein